MKASSRVLIGVFTGVTLAQINKLIFNTNIVITSLIAGLISGLTVILLNYKIWRKI